MDKNSSDSHIAAHFIEFYEKLSLSSIATLSKVVHDDVNFQDPFNNVTGIEKYSGVMREMFMTVPDIKFSIISHSYAGEICYLRWKSSGSLKMVSDGPWVIEGVSELTFHSDGRVLTHIDFWDAGRQFYEYVPVLGRLIKAIRRRLSYD